MSEQEPKQEPRDLEFTKFAEVMKADENGARSTLLLAHLYCENLIERIIVARCPKGELLISRGRLSFAQKLLVIDALGCLPNTIASALQRFNRLRNQCAHNISKTVTVDDLNEICSSFKDTIVRKQLTSGRTEVDLFSSVCAYLVGYLGATAVEYESYRSTDTRRTANREFSFEEVVPPA